MRAQYHHRDIVWMDLGYTIPLFVLVSWRILLGLSRTIIHYELILAQFLASVGATLRRPDTLYLREERAYTLDF